MKVLKWALVQKICEEFSTYFTNKLKSKLWETYRRIFEHNTYYLQISSSYNIYDDLCRMLHTQGTPLWKHYNWASGGYLSKEIQDVPRNAWNQAPVMDVPSPITINYKGHKIMVSLLIQDQKEKSSGAIGIGSGSKVQLSCKHSIQLLYEYCNELTAKYATDKGYTVWIGVINQDYSATRLNCISSTEILPPILRDDVLESIAEDMLKFSRSKQWYKERGIPYHRGYCFYGPPGTGKSSLIPYLASVVRRSVYYIPASTLAKGDLARATRSMGDCPLLVIEDIDCLYKGRTPVDPDFPNFSDLLNALDGLAASDNLIYIFTTNDIESLDPALIRPGRVDRLVCLDYCDQDQIEKLVKRFFPESTLKIPKAYEGLYSPAHIQQLLLSSESPKDFYKRLKNERPTVSQ